MNSSNEQPSRISDELLDQLIGDRDPQELFHSGELLDDLKRRLAERMLDGEMDHHLAPPDELAAGHARNGHKTCDVVPMRPCNLLKYQCFFS
ncbi:MAG: hypothetical protein F4W90_09465 [Gammaproteobacteria bacterium]|nr:hypothetical protein [Gammaproteobacteria bacterium]